MNKEIKYTSENLFDIKNLRHTIYCQIEECNIQKRILDVKIKTLQEIVNALDRHIGSIEEEEKGEEYHEKDTVCDLCKNECKEDCYEERIIMINLTDEKENKNDNS